MDAAPHIHRPILALGIRIGAIAALSTMAALIKLVNARGVHLAEILFWRQAVFLPIGIAWAFIIARSLKPLATKRPADHVRRALYGMLGMVLNFGGVILLPLAEATTMGFTAPIFAVILAAIVLRDRVGMWRWSAVVLGFVGILLIAQPGSGHIPLVGALVALGGAFMIALISIQIADLNKTETPLSIVFYFSLVSTPLYALALPFVSTGHDAETWWLLLLIGLVGSVGQLLLTAALRFGKVASVVVMDYSSLFWATLYGWFLFDRLPPASTWLGIPLIVGAGLLITWREHVLSRRRFADQRQASGT